MIYLDSAAVVKLVHAEAESDSLRAWLDKHADEGWICSALVEVESFRALARYAPEAIAGLSPILDVIEIVDLTPNIRINAQLVAPVTVRSLDAIHLASACAIRRQLTAFVTYDKRLAEAAAAACLPVEAP